MISKIYEDAIQAQNKIIKLELASQLYSPEFKITCGDQLFSVQKPMVTDQK